jgi:subtilisin family serine protease
MRGRTHGTAAGILTTAAAVMLAGCGGGDEGDPDAGGGEVAYPPAFEVSEELSPKRETVPGLDGERGARPVARITGQLGGDAHFVANEVLVSPGDREELQALLERRGGKVLGEIDFPEGTGVPPTHIVRIDPSGAETDELSRDIHALDELARGSHRLSSRRGLELLAIAAHERARRGLDVGLNWILEPDTLRDRSTHEAPDGEDADPGRSDTPYSRDAADWPYMAGGTAQDIGVIEAWRVLEQTGRLNNQVLMAIADGGFADMEHLPAQREAVRGAWGQPNPWGCGPNNPCPWHGTDVAAAATGVPDDDLGAAGPAGPVAGAAFLQSPAPDIGAFLQYIGDAVRSAVQVRPRILNISSGAWIPASAAVVTNRIVDNIGRLLRRELGILVFASAGNDGDSVDNEHCAQLCAFGGCVGKCWETGTHVPCENWGIMCVGGLHWDSTNAHPGSNHGTKDQRTVDIWGPYEVWTGPNPDDDGVNTVTGTSFASPFVAGVGALVMAADPSLGPTEVAQTLRRTAHPGSGEVSARVHAFGAIQEVYGGDVPPQAHIEAPRPGRILAPDGLHLEAQADDPESGSVDVRWTSDVAGELGTTAELDTGRLSYGEHTITLEVIDEAGQTATDSVDVTLYNPPPSIEILLPLNQSTRYTTEQIRLKANASDNEDSPRVEWTSSQDGVLGRGEETPATLSEGLHAIEATVTDSGDLKASDVVVIGVEPSPSNSPPGGVHIVEPAPEFGADRVTLATQMGQTMVSLDVEATATDPEGEPLTYEWSTDRSDLGPTALGTGRVTTVALAHGEETGTYVHQLTVTVTDGAGHARRDTIEVAITVYGG